LQVQNGKRNTFVATADQAANVKSLHQFQNLAEMKNGAGVTANLSLGCVGRFYPERVPTCPITLSD